MDLSIYGIFTDIVTMKMMNSFKTYIENVCIILIHEIAQREIVALVLSC